MNQDNKTVNLRNGPGEEAFPRFRAKNVIDRIAYKFGVWNLLLATIYRDFPYMLNNPIIVILIILLVWASSATAIALIPYAPLSVYFLAVLVSFLKRHVKTPNIVRRLLYSAKPNPPFVRGLAQIAGKTVGLLTLFLTPFSLRAAFDSLFG